MDQRRHRPGPQPSRDDRRGAAPPPTTTGNRSARLWTIAVTIPAAKQGSIRSNPSASGRGSTDTAAAPSAVPDSQPNAIGAPVPAR
jgi:hypothetical protein